MAPTQLLLAPGAAPLRAPAATRGGPRLRGRGRRRDPRAADRRARADRGRDRALACPGLGLGARRGRRDPQHGPGDLAPSGGLVAPLSQGVPVAAARAHDARAPSSSTFEIPDVGRAGLAICYDGFFPEMFRQLAWMGAEVVLQPTLTTTSDRDAELVMARANAIVNQLYVVNVNAAAPAAPRAQPDRRPGGTGPGRARASGEELVTDVLDLDAVDAGARVRDRGRLADVGADRPRRRRRGRAADVRERPDSAAAGTLASAARRPTPPPRPSARTGRAPWRGRRSERRHRRWAARP